MRDDIDWVKANNIVGEGLYSGLSKVLVDVSHRQLAQFGNIKTCASPVILEIGAGRGEHLKFVKADYSKYVMTDISEWGKTEIEEIIKLDHRISFELANIEKLSFPDNTFDRVICTCVLIHVDEPFLSLEELKRVTKPGGVISFYIAADPGALLRLMRQIFTKPKMKKLDVPYSLLNSLSHRNSAGGLVEISKYVFRNSKVKITYFPFHIKSWNLSTHIIVNVIKGKA